MASVSVLKSTQPVLASITMHTAWGITMVVIGLMMSIGGLTKSDFIVYRVLAMRSRLLWGDKVHLFHVVSGLLVAAFGVLFALGIVGR